MLDDAVRDVDLLAPPPTVAARRVCSRGTVKRRSGTTGEDISLGGILVRPGDWLVGDPDGVVVIPAERVVDVADAARRRLAKETRIAELVRDGLTVMDANSQAMAEQR